MAAFLAAFYVVFAAIVPVQWVRDQPSTVVASGDVTVLPAGAMKLYKDAALTQELTSGDVLQFSVPQPQPPLDRLFFNPFDANVFLWLKNEFSIPLDPPNYCCTDFLDSQGNKLGSFGQFDEGCCGGDIQPGEARKIRIRLNPRDAAFGQQFSIFIFATGETGDAQASPLSIQHIREEPMTQQPEQ